MSRGLLTLAFATASLVLGGGCSDSGEDKSTVAALAPFVVERSVRPKGDATATAEQAAIQALLEANRAEFNGRFAGLTAEATPADVTKTLAGYAAAMEQQPLAGCPLPVRAVFGRHVKDWKALTSALGRLPNAYEGVEFLDMLQALFQSASERGKPLGADVVNAVRAVTKSLGELHAAAEKAGMELVK